MRILPFLTALIVAAALYLLVFERDRLLGFAGAEAAADKAVADENAKNLDTSIADAQPAERHVAVLVQKSRAQQVDNAVLARGRTEAARQVEVRAETSGLVISEPLRRGAYVTAGQKLCELDEGTRQASLAEAEARLAEARIGYTAASRLGEEGYGSESRTVGAKALLQAAEAGVKAAEREIGNLTMVAPFDGLLESDTAELGSLLQPGALCALVIQLNPIKLVGFVPETEVDQVAVGAKAGARLVTGRDVMGRVSFLSRSADPETRTFRVEVTVDNADLSIRDGQTAEMLIATEGRQAHLLPGSALTLDNDGQLGLRIVNAESRAEFMPVTVLRDTPDGMWLTGLPDEVDVIVQGQEFVIDGVAADVTYKEPQP